MSEPRSLFASDPIEPEIVGAVETEAPKKRAKATPKKKADDEPSSPRELSPGQKVVGAYIAGFVAKWNHPEDIERAKTDKTVRIARPMKNWGRDVPLAKKMIDSWGEEMVLDLLARFFRTTDPRITRTQYTFLDFYNTAQHLMLRERRSHTTLDERTANNVDAVARAMGRKDA